jgi:hypothetical protein
MIEEIVSGVMKRLVTELYQITSRKFPHLKVGHNQGENGLRARFQGSRQQWYLQHNHTQIEG